MSKENFEVIKKKIVQQMVRAQIGRENQKYGEFIKQTNEVQLMLAMVVLQRSSFPDKKYVEDLFERAQFGTLINLFQACARKTASMYKLLHDLRSYQGYRNRLAHKMYSPKKLTPAECDEAIVLGARTLKSLRKLAKIKGGV